MTVSIAPDYAELRQMFIGVDNIVFRPTMTFESGSRIRHRQLWAIERVAKPSQALVALTASPTFAGDRTLYAAASDGVYRSTSGGLSWKAIDEGLTVRSIVSLAISPAYAEDRTVFAVSLGGRVWRLIDR